MRVLGCGGVRREEEKRTRLYRHDALGAGAPEGVRIKPVTTPLDRIIGELEVPGGAPSLATPEEQPHGERERLIRFVIRLTRAVVRGRT